jgi:hypothetical protein
MFYSGGEVAVDVRDVAAAQRWYSEKLGLGYFSTEVKAEEGSTYWDIQPMIPSFISHIYPATSVPTANR